MEKELIIRKSVCKISVEGSTAYATGWICSDDGYIITVGHLFTGSLEKDVEIPSISFKGDIKIEIDDHEQMIARFIVGRVSSDLNVDFAVLKVIGYTEPLNYAPLDVNEISPNNSNIRICGYSDNKKYDLSCKFEGYADFGANNYKIAITSENTQVNGFSGSPIYTSLGVFGFQYEATNSLDIIYSMSIRAVLEQIRSNWFSEYSLLKNSISRSLYNSKRREASRNYEFYSEFCERPEEQSVLLDFISLKQNKFSWISINGDAGTGKSRLLENLAYDIDTNLCWDIKMYRHISADDKEDFVNIRRNTIFVIDGISRYDLVGEFVNALLRERISFDIKMVISDRRRAEVVKSLLAQGVRSSNHKNYNLVNKAYVDNINLDSKKLADSFYRKMISNLVPENEEKLTPVNLHYLLNEIFKIDPSRSKPQIAELVVNAYISSGRKKFDSSSNLYKEILNDRMCEQRAYFEHLVNTHIGINGLIVAEDVHLIIALNFGLDFSVDDIQKCFPIEWKNISLAFGESYGNVKRNLSNLSILDEGGVVARIQPSLIAEHAFLETIREGGSRSLSAIKTLWNIKPLEFADAVSKLFGSAMHGDNLSSFEPNVLRDLLIPENMNLDIVDSNQYISLISNAVSSQNENLSNLACSLLDDGFLSIKIPKIKAAFAEAYAVGISMIDNNRVHGYMVDRMYRLALEYHNSEFIAFFYLKFVNNNYHVLSENARVIELFERNLKLIDEEDYYDIYSTYLANQIMNNPIAYYDHIAYEKLRCLAIEDRNEESVYNYLMLLVETIQYDDMDRFNFKLQIFESIREKYLHSNRDREIIDLLYAHALFVYPFIVFDRSDQLNVKVVQEQFRISNTPTKPTFSAFSRELSLYTNEISESHFDDVLRSADIQIIIISNENYWDIVGDSLRNAIDASNKNLDIVSRMLADVAIIKQLMPIYGDVTLSIPDLARLKYSISVYENLIDKDYQNYTFFSEQLAVLYLHSIVLEKNIENKKNLMTRFSLFCDKFSSENSKVIDNIFAMSLSFFSASANTMIDSKFIVQLEKLIAKYDNDKVMTHNLLNILSQQVKFSDDPLTVFNKMETIIEMCEISGINLLTFYFSVITYVLGSDSNVPSTSEMDAKALQINSLFYGRYKELLEDDEVSAKGVFGALFSMFADTPIRGYGALGDILLEAQKMSNAEIALTLYRNIFERKASLHSILSRLLDRFLLYVQKNANEPLCSLYCLELLFQNLMLASNEKEAIVLLRKYRTVLDHEFNDRAFFAQSYINYLFVLSPCSDENDNNYINSEITDFSQRYRYNEIIIELHLGQELRSMYRKNDFTRLEDASYWEKNIRHINSFSHKKDIVYSVGTMLLLYIQDVAEECSILHAAIDKLNEFRQASMVSVDTEPRIRNLLGELHFELGARLLRIGEVTKTEIVLKRGFAYDNEQCHILLTLMVQKNDIKVFHPPLAESLPDHLVLGSDFAKLVQSLYLSLSENDWLMADLIIGSLENINDDCVNLLSHFEVYEFEFNLLTAWLSRHNHIELESEIIDELKSDIMEFSEDVPDWLFVSDHDATLMMSGDGRLSIETCNNVTDARNLFFSNSTRDDESKTTKKIKTYVLKHLFNEKNTKHSHIGTIDGSFSIDEAIKGFQSDIQKRRFNSIEAEIKKFCDTKMLTAEQCLRIAAFLLANDLYRFAKAILECYYNVYPFERSVFFALLQLCSNMPISDFDVAVISKIDTEAKSIADGYLIEVLDVNNIDWQHIEAIVNWLLKRDDHKTIISLLSAIEGIGGTFAPDNIIVWGKLISLLGVGSKDEFIETLSLNKCNYNIYALRSALKSMTSSAHFASLNMNKYALNELLATIDFSSESLFALAKIMLSSGFYRADCGTMKNDQYTAFKHAIPVLMYCISSTEVSNTRKKEILKLLMSALKRRADITAMIENSNTYDFLYRKFKNSYEQEFAFEVMEKIKQLSESITSYDYEQLDMLVKRFTLEMEVGNG